MVKKNLSGSSQPVRYSLKRNEILRGEKQYQRIIYSGKVLKAGIIQCYYVIENIRSEISRSAIRVGVSVPQRRVRKAVDRNRLKRLMRESFRIHKPMLVEQLQKKRSYMDVLFIYRGKAGKIPRYMKLSDVLPDMIRSVELLKDRIKEGSEK